MIKYTPGMSLLLALLALFQSSKGLLFTPSSCGKNKQYKLPLLLSSSSSFSTSKSIQSSLGHEILPGVSTSAATSTTVLHARRKSLRKIMAGDNNSRGIKPMAGGDDDENNTMSSKKKKTNWVPVQGITSMSALPQEENVVKLVDTMADSLINGATNPTGAVSIISYKGKTYCFASSCACCQIPLTKAKVLPPNEETGGAIPRLACDFCKATYNIRTGERVKNAEGGGLLGGVVSGLFSKKDKDPLPIYDLGEKNGQVVINLP